MATDIDTLLQDITEIKTFVQERAKTSRLESDEIKRLTEAMVAVQKDLTELRRERISRLSSDGRIMVRDGRLTGYTAFDLAMLKGIMEGRLVRRRAGAGPLIEEISKVQRSLAQSVTPDVLFGWEERAMLARRTAYGFGDHNPALRSFERDLGAWRNQLQNLVARTKALDSTTAGLGDELVMTMEASELWMDVNLDTVILPIMQQVPMPTNPYQYPIQFGDVNWYPSDENVQVLTTDPATQRVTMTAYGLKAGVPFSDELEEDAIIALVPELRATMSRNAAEVIDDVILNGDTTVLNGINSDGATIAKTTAGKAHWLLGFDGLIHQAIVDNSANQSRDHNAAVSAAMFISTLQKMGIYAAPKRRSDVVFISDVNTAISCLTIAELETVDTAGVRATMSTGEILNAYGKPFIHTDQMRIADTDGKVTDSGGNTVGRLLAVNTSQWRVGFRRQIQMEADREPGKGQTTLYMSFRIALTERSGTRSTAKHTAISYNITGVA